MSQNNRKQLDALKGMQSFLSRYCLELTDKLTDYIEWINKLSPAGVEDHVVKKIDNEFRPQITKHINSVIDSIEGEQLKLIRDSMIPLEDYLSRFGG